MFYHHLYHHFHYYYHLRIFFLLLLVFCYLFFLTFFSCSLSPFSSTLSFILSLFFSSTSSFGFCFFPFLLLSPSHFTFIYLHFHLYPHLMCFPGHFINYYSLFTSLTEVQVISPKLNGTSLSLSLIEAQDSLCNITLRHTKKKDRTNGKGIHAWTPTLLSLLVISVITRSWGWGGVGGGQAKNERRPRASRRLFVYLKRDLGGGWPRERNTPLRKRAGREMGR